MKKQDCSIFMEEVLTVETPLTGPAALHVQSCPECAALREMAEKCALKTAVPEILACADVVVSSVEDALKEVLAGKNRIEDWVRK